VADEPPSGAPWDLPLVEAPLAFVDLEMTGLDPNIDRVIEVCIVRTRGNKMEDSLETLVNPGKDVRFGTDVHGIGPQLLVDAPPFSNIAPRVLSLLDGAVLVAHGASWDVAFLEAELARLGQAVRIPFYLDTLILARRALRSESHALGALAAKLGIPRGVAHRAGDDVRVLRELFEQLVADLSPQSVRDLWHVRIAERHARPEIVERCLALAGTGEVARITYRPSHKPPSTFDAIVTQVRTDLDPPRVLGYSLPGRGRFDLRADRILSIDAPPKKDETAPS
jgi:DNA polymerase-3 subunit epsilon